MQELINFLSENENSIDSRIVSAIAANNGFLQSCFFFLFD